MDEIFVIVISIGSFLGGYFLGKARAYWEVFLEEAGNDKTIGHEEKRID